LRLIPTYRFWLAKESDYHGSPVKRVVTMSDDTVEKDTVTLNEERGKVSALAAAHA